MKIAGFENFISIDEFYYCLRIDEHEECHFSVSVSEKHLDTYINRLGKECSLENDCFKFSGTVTGLTVTKGIDCCHVEAIVQGRTFSLDQEQRCRIFQDNTKKVSDILSRMGLKEMHCSAEDDEEIQNVIVQNHETDWQFLKRLAACTKKHLFPGEKIRFGNPLRDKQTIQENDIIEMQVSLCQNRSCAVCRLKKRLNLGERAELYRKDFFVDTVTYKKCNEEYIFEYHLSECVPKQGYVNLPFYILAAEVKDNNDPERLGRVRLEYLEPYEDVMKENSMWTECGSSWASKGLGSACVPLKGDIVEVHIWDNSTRVLSSKRLEAFDSRVENPDTRYILTGPQTHIAVNDEKVFIDNSAFRCEMTGDSFKLNCKDSCEIGISEKEITAVLNKSSLKMENSAITLDTDTSTLALTDKTQLVTNGFEVDGKNKIALTASKVDIKGQSGVSIN